MMMRLTSLEMFAGRYQSLKSQRDGSGPSMALFVFLLCKFLLLSPWAPRNTGQMSQTPQLQAAQCLVCVLASLVDCNEKSPSWPLRHTRSHSWKMDCECLCTCVLMQFHRWVGTCGKDLTLPMCSSEMPPRGPTGRAGMNGIGKLREPLENFA